MDRWEALVRFDDEIREAASELGVYGETWVEQLRAAFFALDEDRSYLPRIVERLSNEARKEAVESWLSSFRQCADGAACSAASFEVLLKAKLHGHSVDVDANGAFVLAADTAKTYLYSNDDIVNYGRRRGW